MKKRKNMLCPPLLCLLVFCGAPLATTSAAELLLDASTLPEADSEQVSEQPSLLDAIRMSIEISLAECEDESSCDLVRDKELNTLMTIIDEQVAHLKQGEAPDEVFTKYEKLKETYALYRPKLRDINLGISQLTEEEQVELKQQVNSLLEDLLAYEAELPDEDEDYELVRISEEGEAGEAAEPGAGGAVEAGGAGEAGGATGEGGTEEAGGAAPDANAAGGDTEASEAEPEAETPTQ